MSILGFMILVFAVIGVVVSIERLYKFIRNPFKRLSRLEAMDAVRSQTAVMNHQKFRDIDNQMKQCLHGNDKKKD